MHLPAPHRPAATLSNQHPTVLSPSSPASADPSSRLLTHLQPGPAAKIFSLTVLNPAPRFQITSHFPTNAKTLHLQAPTLEATPSSPITYSLNPANPADSKDAAAPSNSRSPPSRPTSHQPAAEMTSSLHVQLPPSPANPLPSLKLQPGPRSSLLHPKRPKTQQTL